MTGPHRALLLQEGAMAALLRAALDRTEEASCRRSIERAAAVGVMYLCTLVRPGVACVAPWSRSLMSLMRGRAAA